MSELRAPDPTLTALDDELVVAIIHRGGPPALAHRIEYERGVGYFAACDIEDPEEYLPVASGDARWFSVPCRECFPDAPEPGYVNVGGKRTALSAGLHWQVAK